MSHYFGVEEIREKLFIVTGLALSGKRFCERYHMGSTENYKSYFISEYTKLTKMIISNNIIEISVKTRCLADALAANGIRNNIEKTITTYGSGSCANGKKNMVDFRFICNKIIHATEFNLDFKGNTSLPNEMIWWSGQVTVSGKLHKERWEFFFSIIEWCDAIFEYLNTIEKDIETVQKNSRDIFLRGQ